MSDTEKWYIVKEKDNKCQIISLKNDLIPEVGEYWGPFSSSTEAIAARVGLIRTGKCLPS